MIMKHLLLCEVKSLVNYTLKIICSDRQTAENLYSSIGSIFTLLSKTADITVILTVQCILFKGYSECSAVGAWSITDIQSKGSSSSRAFELLTAPALFCSVVVDTSPDLRLLQSFMLSVCMSAFSSACLWPDDLIGYKICRWKVEI